MGSPWIGDLIPRLLGVSCLFLESFGGSPLGALVKVEEPTLMFIPPHGGLMVVFSRVPHGDMVLPSSSLELGLLGEMLAFGCFSNFSKSTTRTGSPTLCSPQFMLEEGKV